MIESKWCPDCKMVGWFGQEYCVNCGVKLQKEPVCSCGERLYRYFKHCPSCGKPVTNKEFEFESFEDEITREKRDQDE